MKSVKNLSLYLVIFSVILFGSNIIFQEAYAIKESDLIITVFAEDSLGKKYLVVGAQCIVTDRFGNVMGLDSSNGAGLVHIPLRAADSDLPSRIFLSCNALHFEGMEVFEINEDRFYRDDITMKSPLY